MIKIMNIQNYLLCQRHISQRKVNHILKWNTHCKGEKKDDGHSLTES